ncbi:FadR/GntR family transcriptional regulator [Sciscionella sediminilitoris]|uniref:FadR/GntR family transcriptional regulator n=1 Tax=Sciscionella sediminilitoris TaxID=1445613 RepID=UPI0018D074D9|nr:FadR/GntR family transcriptional regulator [Sciscionella sp. SE31]
MHAPISDVPAHNGSAPEPRATAYDQVAARVRQQILDGTLKVGDRLPTEPELSAQYRVSRNTAREAFRVLASQGLVTTKRGVTGGVFVSRPTPGRLADNLLAPIRLLTEDSGDSTRSLAEIRDLLEIHGVGLAARRRTAEELEHIREALVDPGGEDLPDLYASEYRFHTRVLAAAHNPVFEVGLEPVLRILGERLLGQHLPAQFARRIDREHREIFRHLAAGNQAGARVAMHAHLAVLHWHYEYGGSAETPIPRQAHPDPSESTSARTADR